MTDDLTPTRNGNRSPPTMLPPPAQIDVSRPTPRVMREIVLKWTFKSSDETTVQMAHAMTLRAIARNFTNTEVQIFSKVTGLTIRNQELFDPEFPTTKYRNYFRMVPTSFRRKKDGTTPPKKYSVYHRIHTTFSLRELKQTHAVMDSLQEHQCHFSEHLWREDVTNVKDVGWFISYNPKYGMCEQMVAGVRRTLSEKAHVRETDLPPFKIYKTTIVHTYGRTRYVTYAYALQCLGRDAEYLMSCLMAAYDEEAKFVYFRSKYNYQRAYANAIVAQQLYLDETSVVSIKGISPTIMWNFEEYLKSAVPEIHHVLKTPKSDSEGRYNLVTTKEKRDELAKDLVGRLSDIYNQFLGEATPTDPRVHDAAFPWPTMASRINVQHNEEGSESGSPTNSIRSDCGMTIYSACSYVQKIAKADNEPTTDPFKDSSPSDQTPLTTVVTNASGLTQPPVSDLTSIHSRQIPESPEVSIFRGQMEVMMTKMSQMDAMMTKMESMEKLIALLIGQRGYGEPPHDASMEQLIARLIGQQGYCGPPQAINPMAAPRSPIPDPRPTKRNDVKSTPPPVQPPLPSEAALDQTPRQLWSQELEPPQDMEESDPPTDQP